MISIRHEENAAAAGELFWGRSGGFRIQSFKVRGGREGEKALKGSGASRPHHSSFNTKSKTDCAVTEGWIMDALVTTCARALIMRECDYPSSEGGGFLDHVEGRVKARTVALD